MRLHADRGQTLDVARAASNNIAVSSKQPHPSFGGLVCFTSTQFLKSFDLLSTTTIINSYSEVEDRILKACEAAKRVKKPNIRALSREFNVPYYRLRARLQGRATRTSCPALTKAPDDLQEKALIRWIQQLDSLYSPPTPSMIEVAANQIL
jgi:hypothetical protein